MKESCITDRDCYILYDSDTSFEPFWFSAVALSSRNMLSGPAPGVAGRGPVFLLRAGHEEYACKHYHRGGLPGKFLRDGYLYTGRRRVRSLAEWRLLSELHRRGLPVPRPCAARCIRRGMAYTADLITRLLPGTPLSQRLSTGPVDEAGWRRIGAVLRRLHDQGVWHADLNAHNILLSDDAAQASLVDFDRSRMRPQAHRWKRANLSRLRRSLDKLHRPGAFHFRSRDFEILLDAYHSGDAG